MRLVAAMDELAIAANRFGLGMKPSDPPPAAPRAWLTRQFADYRPVTAGFAGLPSTQAMAQIYEQQQEAKRDAKAQGLVLEAKNQFVRDNLQAGFAARLEAALDSPAPFVERLVHFWANHFAVSADGARKSIYVPRFEADAIRPHVLGRFEDMLFAVERHPAMLIYLDQAQSVGPDSPAAGRAAAKPDARRRGLNENLAREIMELHTLGVRSGYSQADVTEFARALTGWSVGNDRQGTPGSWQYRANVHEPGVRTILGKRYDQAGEAQGAAVLADLGRAPATATHVAAKLARHFVADQPPPALVARLAQAFTRSSGDLPTVYAALVAAPEAWATPLPKFKAPWDWLVSALRGLDGSGVDKLNAQGLLDQLGQPLWKPGSPAGWDDVAASWAAPDALVRRVEVAQRMAALAPGIDARALAPQLLPGVLSARTAQEIARAESPAAALALLLVAPEFQRR